MTGARQTMAVIITFRNYDKTDWSFVPALIGQAEKETPCTLARNVEEADPDERIPSGKKRNQHAMLCSDLLYLCDGC